MYGVCMVFKVMPLFKLHSLMERVRSGAFIGGWSIYRLCEVDA